MEGLKELSKRMDNLSDELIKKTGRTGLRKAANVIRDKARQNAKAFDDSLTSEMIHENVVVKFAARQSRNGNIMMRVGVLGGAKQYAKTKANVRSGKAGQTYATGGSKSNPGGDTFYWRFLELGTRKMAAKPFLRSAANSKAGEAMETYFKATNKAIDTALKKGLK